MKQTVINAPIQQKRQIKVKNSNGYKKLNIFKEIKINDL